MHYDRFAIFIGSDVRLGRRLRVHSGIVAEHNVQMPEYFRASGSRGRVNILSRAGHDAQYLQNSISLNRVAWNTARCERILRNERMCDCGHPSGTSDSSYRKYYR
jgi:hypothetical protein